PSGRQLLQELARVLAGMPKREAQIGVHNDIAAGRGLTLEKGDFRLSTERALAILVVLAQSGVAPQRLSATGYGPTRPIAPNTSDVARAQNRRVEVLLVAESSTAAP